MGVSVHYGFRGRRDMNFSLGDRLLIIQDTKGPMIDADGVRMRLFSLR